MEETIRKYQKILEQKNTDITSLFCFNLCSVDELRVDDIFTQFDICNDEEIIQVFRRHTHTSQPTLSIRETVRDLLSDHGGWLVRASTRLPVNISFNDDGSVRNYLLGYRQIHKAFGITLGEALNNVCEEAVHIFEREVARVRNTHGNLQKSA